MRLHGVTTQKTTIFTLTTMRTSNPNKAIYIYPEFHKLTSNKWDNFLPSEMLLSTHKHSSVSALPLLPDTTMYQQCQNTSTIPQQPQPTKQTTNSIYQQNVESIAHCLTATISQVLLLLTPWQVHFSIPETICFWKLLLWINISASLHNTDVPGKHTMCRNVLWFELKIKTSVAFACVRCLPMHRKTF